MATVVQPLEHVTQRVILPHVCWETYERLLAEHQESSDLHFTYDQGRLEILVPSLRHENLKHTIATFVELLAGERNIDIEGVGFAALGVLEVWRYDGQQVHMFLLQAGAYTPVEASAAFPGVTCEVIGQFVEASKTLKRTDWQHSVRVWGRR